MSTEALIFYSKFDDPWAWQRALSAELSDLDVRIDPLAGNPREVRYALVWKPPLGFFARFPNLSLIINLGAGIDSLMDRDDLPDVPIARLLDPDMISLMTSYVLFAAIRYARDIPVFEHAQRHRQWHYIHPRALSSVRVGILGLGGLGGAAACALAQLGFRVCGWARTDKVLPGVTCVTGDAALAPLLTNTEILIVMLPLTPDTRDLLGRRELSMLPRGAKLINVSRGAIIDETALIDGLQTGHIAGATLDVFAREPLPSDHRFWSMENVLITPHLASVGVPESGARDVAESIRRMRLGLRPLNLTDPRRGY